MIAIVGLFLVLVLSGILAWATGINVGTMFCVITGVVVVYAVYAWVSMPFKARKARRLRAARAAALEAEGFRITHTVSRGDTDIVFDKGGREWAMINKDRTERFSFEQFDGYSVTHNSNRSSIYKLDCTIKTLDPARPILKWSSVGQLSDGELWAQQMVAIVHS